MTKLIDTYERRFSEYLRFLDSVANGKKTIMIGKDYVVIDRKTYDEMVKNNGTTHPQIPSR